MNVPLLAITKAVKLDFFTGWDRDSGAGEGCCATRHWESLCQVHHKLSYTTFQDMATFTAATKGWWKVLFSTRGTRKKRSSWDSLERAGKRSGRADL